MRRREFIILLSAATAWPLGANGQQSEKVFTIGILTAGSSAPVRTLQGMLRDGLRQSGWIEGTNLIFEGRYADNELDRLPGLAAELVNLEVNVIVAVGTLAPLAAKRATSAIPIVMAAAGGPVESGLVASLARPDGNVTGTSLMAPDLGGKRLELAKELLLQISRAAVLWNTVNPYSALVVKEAERAAAALGIKMQPLEARAPADIDGALEAAVGQHAEALITVEDPLTNDHRRKIAEFALKSGRARPGLQSLPQANHPDPRRAQAPAKRHRIAIVTSIGPAASVQIHSEDSLGKTDIKVSATPAKAGAHAAHGSRPSPGRREPAHRGE